MTRQRTLLLSVASLALAGAAGAQEREPQVADNYASQFRGQKVLTVMADQPRELVALSALQPDFWSHKIGLGPVDVRVTPEQIEAIDQLGIDYEVMIDDLEATVAAEQESIEASRLNRDDAWYSNYKDFNTILAYIDTLAATYPALATTEIIGTTIQGRDIKAIRITGPGNPATKPALLFFGTQHAREWVSPMTVTYIAENLMSRYATDSAVQTVVDNLEFIIVPVVNGDGYEYSWTTERFWRKNRRGGYGVDLNRNWAHGWGGEGSSGSTGSDIYRGTAPFSEPETAALRDLVQADPRIVAHIDFHSYSQLVLRPYGFDFIDPPEPDNTFLTNLGAAMASAIFGTHGMTYQNIPSYDLYLAAGDSTDWFYGDEAIYSYTFELRPSSAGGGGFALPANQILATAQENFNAIMQMAQTFGTPLLLGEQSIPAVVPFGQTTNASITIQDGSGTYQTGSAVLRSRIGSSGAFASTPLTQQGGSYSAALPSADCGETIEFYFEASTTGGTVMSLPSDAPTTVYAADVLVEQVAFFDDMETNQGWTVGAPGDTATTGVWERENPQATPAQPENDNSNPGTLCWVTDGTAGSSIGANDIDGGVTTLTSPTFSALGDGSLQNPEAFVSYYRWYSNDQGNSPNADSMPVSISNTDGATWIELEDVTENANAWVGRTFRINDFVTPTATMKLRFEASDLGNGSIVEAGVDDVTVAIYGCEPAPSCQADWNGDGVLNTSDFVSFLNDYNAVLAGGSPTFGDPDIAAPFGVINSADFIAFLNLYAAGCP